VLALNQRNLPEHLITYRVLVGFSPRMHVYDIITGRLRYLNWQYTWWGGAYTIMLTKAAIMHRDYLPEYDKYVPAEFLTHIDKGRNCEDIAMAVTIAKKVRIALQRLSVLMFTLYLWLMLGRRRSCVGASLYLRSLYWRHQ
jgi:hypothetical protein